MPASNEASGRLPCAPSGVDSSLRSCERCGEEFEPYRPWQRFCPGGRCRREAHREKAIRQEVEKVLVFRSVKRQPKPRTAPPPPGPPDPIVAVMVRALLAALER